MNGNRKMIETENASVDNQTKCIRCGCVFTDVDSEDEMVVVAGKTMCQKCCNDDTTIKCCEWCGEYHYIDNFLDKQTNFIYDVCEDCREEFHNGASSEFNALIERIKNNVLPAGLGLAINEDNSLYLIYKCEKCGKYCAITYDFGFDCSDSYGILNFNQKLTEENYNPYGFINSYGVEISYLEKLFDTFGECNGCENGIPQGVKKFIDENILLEDKKKSIQHYEEGRTIKYCVCCEKFHPINKFINKITNRMEMRCEDCLAGVKSDNISDELKKLILHIMNEIAINVDCDFGYYIRNNGDLYLYCVCKECDRPYLIPYNFGFDCSDNYGIFNLYSKVPDENAEEILGHNINEIIYDSELFDEMYLSDDDLDWDNNFDELQCTGCANGVSKAVNEFLNEHNFEPEKIAQGITFEFPVIIPIEGTGYIGRIDRIENIQVGDSLMLKADWNSPYYNPVAIEVFDTQNGSLGYLSNKHPCFMQKILEKKYTRTDDKTTEELSKKMNNENDTVRILHERLVKILQERLISKRQKTTIYDDKRVKVDEIIEYIANHIEELCAEVASVTPLSKRRKNAKYALLDVKIDKK